MSETPRLSLFALPGIPAVQRGDDVGRLILSAMDRMSEAWRAGDVLAVAQKIVSKAEGRVRLIDEIEPGAEALAIAERCGKDPRKVQAILDESSDVVRVAKVPPDGLVITRHHHGWVSANAGIDESNLGRDDGALLLLPEDPDASARRIADTIEAEAGHRPGVVITDTFGRAWRKALVNVAIGLSDLPAIVDLVGCADAYGRRLRVSQQALADEVAAASGLLMVKNAATPVVVLRGLSWMAQSATRGRDYVRPLKEDLFR